MMQRRIVPLTVLCLPLLFSCTNQSDVDAMYAKVLKNEQQINALSSQMGNVEQVLPGQAEMWAQMQSMRQELNSLRGLTDEVQVRLGGGDGQADFAAVRDKVNRIETLLRRMASGLGVDTSILDAPGATEPGSPSSNAVPSRPDYNPGVPPVTSGQSQTGETGQPGSPLPSAGSAEYQQGAATDTASNLYDSGLRAFDNRRYQDAVKIFTEFASAFPQNKLTSNAWFWKGESNYALKDYGAAVLAYQEVLEKFPGSAKYQSSMLKQGMSFYYAGKKDAARFRLDELIKKYPNSPEAGRAKKFLEDNK